MLEIRPFVSHQPILQECKRVGAYTGTHTFAHQSDFKKPGAPVLIRVANSFCYIKISLAILK